MRYFPLLSLLTLVACGESGPAASGRLETGGAGGQPSEDGGTAGSDGAAALEAGTPEVAAEVAPVHEGWGADAGSDASPIPAGQISVTWTLVSCGDNPVTVGITDETTHKGIAGPLTIQRRMPNYLNSSLTVTFTCTPGDEICWTSSVSFQVCGACVDKAMPNVGC